MSVTITPEHYKKQQKALLASQTAVSHIFDVTLTDLLGQGRPSYVAHARQAAMVIARSMIPISHTDTARAFNREDHETSRYACKVVPARRETDGDFNFKFKQALKMAQDLFTKTK